LRQDAKAPRAPRKKLVFLGALGFWRISIDREIPENSWINAVPF